MAPSSSNNSTKKHPVQHLIAGGCAGLVESSICHPLDTIKTRMQLRRQTTTVEKAVERVRHSLMEPAMRLRHSMGEPGQIIMRHSLHDPTATVKPTRTATMMNGAKSASTVVNANQQAIRVVGSGGGGAALHEPVLSLAGAGTVPHVAKITIEPTATTASAITTGKKVMLHANTVAAPLGPIGTARRIVQREGFFALYKGLSAVVTGIVPKMAVRFVSFEQYRDSLIDIIGPASSQKNVAAINFTAGLASGLTEAVLIVTPAEVCKIRMQSQYHSMIDPTAMQHRKYLGVIHTAMTIVREEGIGALYKGIVPTMLRQGCNQAVNFTAYNWMKRVAMEWQHRDQLDHWQSLVIGGVSGGMGPLVNNPLDVVKTRLQKQVVLPGKAPKYTGLLQACVVIAKEEGVFSLWKGITPRLLRIMPGQAITFMTYEAVSEEMNRFGLFQQ